MQKANSYNKKTMANGIAFLAVVGFINKMIGVLFRIPLANLIGDEGIGIYHLVFPSYALLLTVSTAGIPVAISRLISANLAKGNIYKTKQIFKVSILILFVLACASSFIMIINASSLSYRVGNTKTYWGFIAIAPSLFFVCIISALRGYVQGFNNMKPSGLSQLVEQIAKVVFALPLAYYGLRQGVGIAAAYALFGTSIAEFLALIYLLIYCYKTKNKVDYNAAKDKNVEYSKYQIFKDIIKISIPIMLGTCIVPVSQFIDSAMLVVRLTLSAGFDSSSASSLYGLYTGYVITLINVPTAFAIAIAAVTVPYISRSSALSNIDELAVNANNSLRYSSIIGLPCSFGMFALSREIIYFFYSSLGAEKISLTANLLNISSFTIILFILVQTSSAILQGLGKERIPTYTLLVAVIIKVIVNYFLVGTTKFNIFGAPIASVICYTVSLVPNLYYVKKYCKAKFNVMQILIKPLLASLAMFITVYAVKLVLPFSRISTIVALFVGAISYMIFIVLFRVLSKGEIELLLKRIKRK